MVHEQRRACVSSSESAPTSPKASSSSSPRRFASFDAARRELLTGCGAEFFKATGGCSRRVGAIARGAAWMTALGEFWATEATKNADGKADHRAAVLLSRASVETVRVAQRLRLDQDGFAATSHARPPEGPFAMICTRRINQGRLSNEQLP